MPIKSSAAIKPKSAFSLVELSVSILIIAILIAGIMSGMYLVNRAHLTQARMLTATSDVVAIKGLAVWLESVMPESFDSAIIEDQSKVVTWLSRGSIALPENNAISLGVSTTDPVYLQNLSGGLPAIQFDGEHYLVAPDAMTRLFGSANHDGDYTLVFVESAPQLAADGKNYFLALDDGNDNASDKIGYDSPTKINFFGHTAVIDPVGSGTRVHMFISSGATKTYLLNGKKQTQLTSNSAEIKLADLKFIVDEEGLAAGTEASSKKDSNNTLLTKLLKQNLKNNLVKVAASGKWLIGNNCKTCTTSKLYFREIIAIDRPISTADQESINQKYLIAKWRTNDAISSAGSSSNGSPGGGSGNYTCLSTPCQNGGSCNTGTGICTCIGTYSGNDCGTNLCPANYCQNNGTCAVSNGSAVCTCVNGYLGTTCSNDACSSHPCLNNGTCAISGTAPFYACTCATGFTGTTCADISNVDCWGQNDKGQAPAHASGSFTNIATGQSYTCGVKTDGNVACFGSGLGNYGQAPALVTGPFTKVSAAVQHTCAIKTSGSIACWGISSFGEAPPTISGSFTSLSLGSAHTCALRTNGSVSCWGWNAYGQAPATVSGTFTSISAGSYHTCGVKTDGNVTCWGGTGIVNEGQAPALVTGPFTSVSAGYNHSCAIRTDGNVTCWGANSAQQAPASVNGPFSSISAGTESTCGLKTDGSVTCWGDNSYTQSPATISGPFTSISAVSSYHNCGIKAP